MRLFIENNALNSHRKLLDDRESNEEEVLYDKSPTLINNHDIDNVRELILCNLCYKVRDVIEQVSVLFGIC